MWICFNDGFVSAVEDWENPNRLAIRARRRDILKVLFPNREIVVTTQSDYKYRVFCSREELAQIVAARITNIGYPNFKGSVQDKDLKNLYGNFWGLHYRYQR